MSAQTVPHASTTLRQIVVRRRRVYVPGLLIVAALLVAYRLASVPAAPAAPIEPAQTAFVDPAAQSVLDYLRVHSALEQLPRSAAPFDPAQASVLSYLRVHERVEQSPAPWNPAVQAVLDYLRVHGR